MNCQELTTVISNIKAQISELDSAVGARKPEEAINIKNDIIKQFSNELLEYIAPFYRDPTPENYDKEVNRILNKIGDRDPSEVTFSRKELIFIYDTDDKAKFGTFNQESIIKIKEIRDKRISKQKEDASIIFNLSSDQIAWAEDRITSDTKIYIGSLFHGIFDLPNLDQIYTSFPEGKIRMGEFVTCGKNGEEIFYDLRAKGIYISDYAEDMLRSSKFVVYRANETIPTIRLKVSGLFPDGKTHTYDEIITRARELGLDDNLPHETASNLLLNESTQPNLDQWYAVASKTIINRENDPAIFELDRDEFGLCFKDISTDSAYWWNPDDEFLFCFRSSAGS